MKNLAIKQKEELKKLQSLLIKQKSEIDLIRRERQLINERLSVAERNLKNTEEELKKLKTGNKIIVSEHAVLRYLERTMELDLKAVENEILSKEVVSQYRTLGNGKYPVSNGYKAVIKDNVVLTITK